MLLLDPLQVLQLCNLAVDLLIGFDLDNGRAFWNLDLYNRFIVVGVAQLLCVLGADWPGLGQDVLVVDPVLVLRDVGPQHFLLEALRWNRSWVHLVLKHVIV